MAELFGITVTRHFRTNSGHLNERVYCKPMDRRLKRSQIAVSQLSTTDHSWVVVFQGCFSRIRSAVLGIKRKHKYKILKKFLSKKRLHNLQKVPKKYNSKCSGCHKYLIKICHKHVQNKNFNLRNRHI